MAREFTLVARLTVNKPSVIAKATSPQAMRGEVLIAPEVTRARPEAG